MKILSIDPGDKRIGIAISDDTGSFVRPLTKIIHKSRREDSLVIVEIAESNNCGQIIIGQALLNDGSEGVRARSARRLKEMIEQFSSIKVILWDESHTTEKAQELFTTLGINRKRKSNLIDSISAKILLEDYLLSKQSEKSCKE